MKKIFSTDINTNYLDILSLILRLCIAAFMITHGYPKLMKLLAGGEIKFADIFGLGATVSLALAVFSEFFCSIFIALGLGTRLASVPLIFTMLVAAFVAHGGDPFKKKEMALMYLLVYIVLFVIGSGKFSLDYFINKQKN